MAYSDVLLEKTRPIREKILSHPFVQGIGDGTLSLPRFRFYMCQDYVFLVEYCRVFALAVAKGTDLSTMGRFGELLSSTLNVEMDLHRSYAAEFGITREDLERTTAAATTHGYTRHLLAVAWSGGVGEIAASLLPCQWGYWEIAGELSRRGGTSEGNRYARWIEMYTSPEYVELAGWIRSLVDASAEGARPDDLARMGRAFLTSSRYELMFWEMAWREEDWPV